MIWYMILSIAQHMIHVFFFFNDTATTEIYTLSLHDALPICCRSAKRLGAAIRAAVSVTCKSAVSLNQLLKLAGETCRSEEHTSELQSRQYLVCRLLLEKKKKNNI